MTSGANSVQTIKCVVVGDGAVGKVGNAQGNLYDMDGVGDNAILDAPAHLFYRLAC